MLLFVVLSNGIKVESLELPKIKISQLYIKLDKKLIVTIHSININIKSTKNTSLEELRELTNKLPYLHSLFKSISIQNIIYNNKTVRFLYKNEIFYVDSDFLTIDARLISWEDSIEVDINQMILKDFIIEVKGNLQIKTKEKLFDFRGNFNTFNIHGGIELRVDNNILYYRANTKKFKTLKPFMDFLTDKIKFEPIIADWIYKKITADEYQLHNIEGKFNLKTGDFYPMSMKAKASGKNVLVKFDLNAPSALVNSVDVILKDDKLIFDVKKAEYKNKDISDTKVHIYNLLRAGLKSGIIIDINAKTTLDDSIHSVLHAFDIQVPITQTSGTTKANVKLDIRFLPFGIANYSGYFDIKDANISLSGLPVYSKNGYIELDNGMIHLQDVNLRYDTVFDIQTSGDLNISSGVYKSDNTVNSLLINFDKLELLHIKDFDTTAKMKIEESGTSIYLENFDTNLEFLTNTNKIIIKDLRKIYPYSKLMKDIDIKNGMLEIDTNDFHNYSIKANLKEMNLPLQKNGIDVKELDLNITTNGSNFKVISSNENIKITKKEELKLFLKDIDTTFDSSKHKKSIDLGKITIIGINSNIIDTNSTLKIPSNHFIYKLDGENISFNSRLFKQSIFMEQTDKTLYLSSKNLNDMFANSVLGKDIFENGSFELHIDGNNTRNLEATIIANNTTVKGLSSYNNLMAFMNTVPSLLTLKNPGFDDNGYHVNHAVLDFKRDDDILTITELKIDGKSADIIGTGTINIKTKKIDINLEIAVLKSLSSVVNIIPLVNYIFLGKDGNIYTKVTIKGTLDKPEMKTHLITDAAISPLGIIKRTIETPFKIFE